MRETAGAGRPAVAADGHEILRMRIEGLLMDGPVAAEVARRLFGPSRDGDRATPDPRDRKGDHPWHSKP